MTTEPIVQGNERLHLLRAELCQWLIEHCRSPGEAVMLLAAVLGGISAEHFHPTPELPTLDVLMERLFVVVRHAQQSVLTESALTGPVAGSDYRQ